MDAKGTQLMIVKFKIPLEAEEWWDADVVEEGEDNSDNRRDVSVVVGGMKVLTNMY